MLFFYRSLLTFASKIACDRSTYVLRLALDICCPARDLQQERSTQRRASSDWRITRTRTTEGTEHIRVQGREMDLRAR
jgi:hypothetical protein